jgi:hypothetical protein
VFNSGNRFHSFQNYIFSELKDFLRILCTYAKQYLKEHQKAVSTLDKGKSALTEHVCYTKHEIAWENAKVITTKNRYGQRLCLEAWHINMNNHALNRDDGAYLPEEYMHLIGR